MSAADFTRAANSLKSLVPQTKREAMQKVTLQGESLMKREVRVKTGTTRRSITSQVQQGGNRGVIGTNVPHARALNDGSKPHIIRPKPPRKALKTPFGYFKVVHHPGTRGTHFVEHTRDRLRPIAERELSQVFGRALGRIK